MNRFAALFGWLIIAAPATHAGMDSLEDPQSAKIARAKATKKARAGEGQEDGTKMGKSIGGINGGCGINLGNIVAPKRGAAPKEVTVVVQGDVIQSGNKCK